MEKGFFVWVKFEFQEEIQIWHSFGQTECPLKTQKITLVLGFNIPISYFVMAPGKEIQLTQKLYYCE